MSEFANIIDFVPSMPAFCPEVLLPWRPEIKNFVESF